MPEFWEQLEDSRVAGAYILRERLNESPATAYFRADAPENSRQVVVRLDRDGAETKSRLARWDRIRGFSDPHLVTILDAGRTELQGVPLLYAVLEQPDEILGEVVRDRTLTPEEARQVLLAVTSGLVAVHAAGLVHGQVTPWNIVSAGDSIKLSSDELRTAAPAVGEHLSPAGDIWALGLTACEILTRRVPDMRHGEADLEAIGVPPEFRDFVRHCLQPDASQRWNAERLLRCLRGDPEPPPAPVRAPDARPPSPPRPAAGRGFSRWIYGAAAAGALALVLYLAGKPSGEAKRPAAPPPPAAPASPPEVPAAIATAIAPATGSWRVIAYTYNARGPAEKKAATINRKWPEAKADVFSPGGSSRYLVSLGGRMTREEAVRLQHKARAKGLPRDTFARNYTH